MKPISKENQRFEIGFNQIDLPADFHAKKVEVTIQPIDDSENGRQLLKDLLLEAPTLTDEELHNVRNWMSKWSVREF